MASVFDTIKTRAGDTTKSATWYRTQVNKIASNTTAGQLFRQGKLNSRPVSYTHLTLPTTVRV